MSKVFRALSFIVKFDLSLRSAKVEGKGILLTLSFLFFLSISHAQDIKYARSIVDTLAAPGMHGRGYVNEGDKIAATYIENEFKKFGLSPFDKSYRQEFTLDVIAFPGKMELRADNKKLVPGVDFVIGDYIAGKGERTVVWLDSALLHKKKKLEKLKKDLLGDEYVFIIDARSTKIKKQLDSLVDKHLYFGEYGPAIIYTVDKLTWTVPRISGRLYSSLPTYILKDKVSRKIKKLSFEVEAKKEKSYQTQNLIGYIPGTQYPDSFIVFSAHYDHLGKMGKDTYFPGANDNASGIAMLLNLAKYYSENKPKYSVAFMAFGAEEAGLVGSKYYTEHPLFPLKQIKFMVNTDLAGTGDEGITVVNGSVFNDEFKYLVKLNAQESLLKDVKVRGKAANSDHYFFSEKGVKAFFIYTMGGIKAYHDIYDKAETLPLTEFEDYFRLLTGFGKYLMNDY